MPRDSHTILTWRDFSFYEDRGSGTVRVEGPWPNVEKAYDRSYYVDSYLKSEAVQRPTYDQLAREALEDSHGPLLDVGCGAGLFLQAVHKLGGEILGIEPSPSAIKIARKMTDAKIIHADSLTMTEWRPRSFGVVVLLDVLAHVPNPDILLNWCLNRLKPGGKIFLKTPNRPPNYYRFLSERYPPNHSMIGVLAHIPYQRFGWGREGIQKTLDEAGFVDVSVKEIQEAFDPGQFAWSDLWHPRRMLYKARLRNVAQVLDSPSLLATGYRKA